MGGRGWGQGQLEGRVLYIGVLGSLATPLVLSISDIINIEHAGFGTDRDPTHHREASRLPHQ